MEIENKSMSMSMSIEHCTFDALHWYHQTKIETHQNLLSEYGYMYVWKLSRLHCATWS